jgi:DnaJ C terminal domain/DnaJ domain
MCYTGWAHLKRYSIPIVLFLFYLQFLEKCTCANAHMHHRNPFQILGVSPHATPKEIKQRYYRLCLQYHPDKQLPHVSAQQRKRCEQMFKDIQWAYEEIGSASPSNWNNLNSRQSSSSSSSSQFAESFRSHMNQYQGSQQWKQQSPYEPSFSKESPFFNTWHRSGNDPFVGFYRFAAPSFATGGRSYHHTPSSSSFASSLWNPEARYLFVQRVTIPLQDLYAGCARYEFPAPNMSLASRIVAAFRGGMGQVLLYQSILYAIPFLRFSKVLSIGFCFYMFIQSLPVIPQASTEPTLFANLLPGYKGNTKFIFHEAQTMVPNVEIQFILREGSHPIYRRIGNDLHVTCRISAREAVRGCTLHIPPLRSRKSDGETPVQLAIRIPPRTESGATIRVPDQGWPIRKTGSASGSLTYGDLVVTVQVTRNSKSSRFPSSRRHPT